MFMLLFILVAVTVTEEHPTVSQATDVLPARIYGSPSTFSIGEYFEVRCSTFGLKKPEEEVSVILCKNGVGVDKAWTKNYDHFFQIKSATKEDSGNYSCVFSKTKHHPSEVKGEGERSIFIRVIDKLYPAIIDANESTVIPGSDTNFRCTSNIAPDTDILLAYLCRNQNIIAIEMWDSWTKQAIFYRKRIQKGDTGNYSCVLSQRPLNATEKNVCGGNSVFLQVNEIPSNVSNLLEATPSPSSGAGWGPLYLLPSVFLLVLLLLLLWKNGTCTRKRSQQVSTEYTHFLPPAHNHVDGTTTGLQMPVQSVYAEGENPVVDRTAAAMDTRQNQGSENGLYDWTEIPDDNSQGLQIPVQSVYSQGGGPGVDMTNTATSDTQQGDNIAPYDWNDIPDHNSQGLQIPVQSVYSQSGRPDVDMTNAATSDTQQGDDIAPYDWNDVPDHNSQGLQIPVQSLYAQGKGPGVDKTAAATSTTQQHQRDDKSSDEWSEFSDESYDDAVTYQEIPDVIQPQVV